MSSVDALLQCLTLCTDTTTLRHLGVIVPALLSMTGRVTMLGISRWTEQGGSYRTIQRFFASPIAWGKLHWCVIRHHLFDPDACYILAGDEVVVTKSGKETYLPVRAAARTQTGGLGRFFSSLYKRPVPGLCFFNFSLIDTKRQRAYPVLSQQVIPDEVDASKATQSKLTSDKDKKKETLKRKSGRPKGSKNKNKKQPILSPYLRFIQDHLKGLLARIEATLPVT